MRDDVAVARRASGVPAGRGAERTSGHKATFVMGHGELHQGRRRQVPAHAAGRQQAETVEPMTADHRTDLFHDVTLHLARSRDLARWAGRDRDAPPRADWLRQCARRAMPGSRTVRSGAVPSRACRPPPGPHPPCAAVAAKSSSAVRSFSNLGVFGRRGQPDVRRTRSRRTQLFIAISGRLHNLHHARGRVASSGGGSVRSERRAAAQNRWGEAASCPTSIQPPRSRTTRSISGSATSRARSRRAFGEFGSRCPSPSTTSTCGCWKMFPAGR